MIMAGIKLGKGRRKTKAATDDVAASFEVMPVAGHTKGAEHATAIAGQTMPAIDENERRRLIAEAAYYRAQRRGFTGGSPEADWLEAEAEVVALLGNAGLRA